MQIVLLYIHQKALLCPEGSPVVQNLAYCYKAPIFQSPSTNVKQTPNRKFHPIRDYQWKAIIKFCKAFHF